MGMGRLSSTEAVDKTVTLHLAWIFFSPPLNVWFKNILLNAIYSPCKNVDGGFGLNVQDGDVIGMVQKVHYAQRLVAKGGDINVS